MSNIQEGDRKVTETGGMIPEITEEQINQFKVELIDSHNQYRSLHLGSPPFNPSDDLQRQAQDWANTVADKGFLQFSETQGVGENVDIVEFLWAENEPNIGLQVAERWYSEQQKYDYDNPRWTRGATNFTQMIWRASHEIGVGICRLFGSSNKYAVVTQYRPPGNSNMPGEFKKNVLSPTSIQE